MALKQPLTADDLRRKAEQHLLEHLPKLSGELDFNGNHQRHLHELQVHQIELEMQNEQLQTTLLALEDLNNRYIDLYNSAPVCYLSLDAQGCITQFNVAAAKLLGLEQIDLNHSYFKRLVKASDQRHFTDFLKQAVNSYLLQQIELALDVGGRDSLVQIEAIYSGPQQECRVTVQDITDRKRAEIDILKGNRELARTNILLRRFAHYDALTSLPNRVLLADRMSQAMITCTRRNNSFAVAYLDLDGFKAVNDQYGHTVGDRLLVSISQSMKTVLREGDTLARIGGDEYVAMLVDLKDPQESEPVLQRLLSAASEPVIIGDLTLTVSVSIGVTIFPQDSADPEQLIRHADQAMYIAKQSGKNRIHRFDVAFDAEVRSHHASVGRIRQALRNNELVLHYQPKVNMSTGKVIGVEALVRWQHTEQGLLPPAQFLPLIESHQINIELGEWVIHSVLTQMEKWSTSGLDLPVSANISALQLQQPNFPARLAVILAAHPLVDPSKLELEIVETSALNNMTEITKLMNQCLKLGVSFTLDDFGTGYSSLTYLRRLPVNILKIDQSFVRDMLEDSNDLAIIQGVIGLADAFNRQVIAEGVENSAQGKKLHAMGCDLAQGFGIAKPMPARELRHWLKGWESDRVWTV